MGAHLSTAGRREAARKRRAETRDTALRQAKRRISRPSRFGLPEDALLGVLAFADYPGVAYGSAVCREFRDALTKIKPDLLHDLALHRFPQLRLVRAPRSLRPDPRALFEEQRRLVAPQPRTVLAITPRRELDSYVFSLELSTRRHGTDEAKSVIHVGEGRVTRDEGRPGIQFDVPASIFTAMMMEEVPLDIYATVLCFRRGTWQRCVLTQTEVDDCDGDTFFFDWIEVPGPSVESERGRLLAWLRQNPEQNADGMNVSAWPLLKLTWDYCAGGSVSHVNAYLMWESVGDLFDMNEAQARMTLEAWCAWTG